MPGPVTVTLADLDALALEIEMRRLHAGPRARGILVWRRERRSIGRHALAVLRALSHPVAALAWPTEVRAMRREVLDRRAGRFAATVGPRARLDPAGRRELFG